MFLIVGFDVLVPGLSPDKTDSVIGVVKAYTTRVGWGCVITKWHTLPGSCHVFGTFFRSRSEQDSS